MKKVLTAEIEGYDAWGKACVVKVSWMPLRAEGVDAALDNVGQSPVLWGDEDNPPVYLWRGNNGGVALKRSQVQLSGTFSQVFESREVDSVDELEPGCFVIVSDVKR